MGTSEYSTRQDLLGYLREVLWRRKWIAAIAWVGMLAVFFSLALWLPSLYRATAVVVIEGQKVSEDFVRPAVTGGLETRLQRIRQELTSRERLGSLIQQLNLYPELRSAGLPFDTVIQQMRDDMGLDLTGVDQSGARGPTIAFSISYASRDPETAANVANILASMYVDENSRIRAGQAARTAAILKEQLDQAKTELDEHERRTSGFRVIHKGELPEQAAANLGSLERLNAQLRLNSDNQLRAMDRRDRLEQQLAVTTSAGAAASPSPHAAELTRLRQELADLRRQFRDTYPDVIRLKAEITTLEKQDADHRAAQARASAAEPDPRERLMSSIRLADAELQGLKGEEASLRRSIASYEQRVENLAVTQEQFETLTRNFATAKERYDGLLKRYEEARLSETLEQGHQVEQFKILDAAIPPHRPAAPGRRRLLMLGLFLSIAFGVGAAIAFDKLDTSYHALDDLRSEVAGVTFISIPFIPTRTSARRQRRRFVVSALAVILALMAVVAGSRYVATGNERISRMVARGAV